VWEEVDTTPEIFPDEVLQLPKSSALGDDEDSTSMFTTVHWTGTSNETTPLVPSSEAGIKEEMAMRVELVLKKGVI
jgi:hypothetical protein